MSRQGERVVRNTFPPELLRSALAPEDEALADGLERLLRRMQRAMGSASFGECQSCAHFRREGDRRFRCGLTNEPLRRVDIERICLEHDPGDAPRGTAG